MCNCIWNVCMYVIWGSVLCEFMCCVVSLCVLKECKNVAFAYIWVQCIGMYVCCVYVFGLCVWCMHACGMCCTLCVLCYMCCVFMWFACSVWDVCVVYTMWYSCVCVNVSLLSPGMIRPLGPCQSQHRLHVGEGWQVGGLSSKKFPLFWGREIHFLLSISTSKLSMLL